MVHQCYICEQIFDSKEKLFEHLEIHSDTTTFRHNKEPGTKRKKGRTQEKIKEGFGKR